MRRKLLISLITIVVLAFGGLAANLGFGNRPALGLDLQGGISITQQPVGDYDPASLDLAVERIRERVDGLGVAEPEILRQGDAIVVNLPGVRNQQEAIELVQVTGQVYLRPVQACINEGVEEPDPATTTTTAGTTTTTATDGSTPTPTDPTTDTGSDTGSGTDGDSAPTGSLDVQGFAPQPRTPTDSTPSTDAPSTDVTTTVPGTDPTTDATTDPTTEPTTEPTVAPTTTLPVSDPTSDQILPLRGGGQCLVGPAGATGEVFDNDAMADIIGGGWAVTVGLRGGAAGEDQWNRLAQTCFSGGSTCPSRRLAIELDGEIVSAPTVNQPEFTTDVQITGQFTESEARRLADVLRSGSLPVRLETQSVQTVSPTLGRDALDAAIWSGVLGVLLVLAFMVLYYRALGALVVAGLAISAALLWSVISFLSRTQGLALSLAGVAGVIVSVGVTVDSYVVFFERLKDEIRSGKTMRNSAQRGFMASWRTILMADIVSLMGAGVLWWLTVGSVRNFAFFLGLSTLIDLVVSYFFTRPAVLLLARTDWMARRKVMGVEAVRLADTTGRTS